MNLKVYLLSSYKQKSNYASQKGFNVYNAYA